MTQSQKTLKKIMLYALFIAIAFAIIGAIIGNLPHDSRPRNYDFESIFAVLAGIAGLTLAATFIAYLFTLVSSSKKESQD